VSWASSLSACCVEAPLDAAAFHRRSAAWYSSKLVRLFSLLSTSLVSGTPSLRQHL
jgi:hypothetical protein